MNIYQQLKTLFGTLWHHTEHKKKFVIMLVFSLFSKLIRFIEPWILGKLFNEIQIKGKDIISELRFRGGLLIIAPLISWIFHGIARIWEQTLVVKAVQNYRAYLFSLATSLPMQWHQDNHSGSVIDKITKAVNALDGFGQSIFMYMYTIVNLIGSIVILGYIWPTILGVLLVVLTIIGLVIWKFDSILIAVQKQQNETSHKISSLLFDYLSNIKTLITLRFEHRARDEVQHKMNELLPLAKKYAVYNELKRFSMDTIIGALIVAMMMVYIKLEFMKKGIVQIGDITIVFGYLNKLRNAFDNITWYYSELIKQGTDVAAVDSIIEAHSKQYINDSSSISYQRKKISIHQLHFSYAGVGTSSILQNIAMTMKAGQKIAFVGESGSGKSTMLALLRGLYATNMVAVDIDGTHYKRLDSITSHTSLIPQDPEIFENTIRYNITCGLDVDDAKIMEYCRLVRFDDVVAALPNGLDTDIKEKGVNLSGGQKQRLALARGLLLSEDSDILLLDEPTSSVDAPNEKQIFTNFLHFFNKKTIVAVMHRLHLLGMFDYIYVFDQGSIVEEGSFKCLVEQDGKLATMWKEYRLEE